jgi:hypothetical protein
MLILRRSAATNNGEILKMITNNKNGYSPREFAKRNGIGVTKLYEEINSGRLIARKCGSRTIITLEEERAWLGRLPKVPSKSELVQKSGSAASEHQPERESFARYRNDDGAESLHAALRRAK